MRQIQADRSAPTCAYRVIIEHMSEQCVFISGDRVSWWDDGHGRGAEPSHPDALHLTGTIHAVCRPPADDSRIVAYLVTRRGGVSGTYTETVRPDLGHRLTHVDENVQRSCVCTIGPGVSADEYT
ncbi:hypothetical protein ACFYO1_03280 [Nocardia sp. NPDC006044]|uniref:hypothetical protein n=1 Tax=Nocardia sp. NPDC006044 TaxID=3364306 RepID=UPI0036D0CB42